RDEAAQEDVEREALERESGEAEVAGQRHLEDLQPLHDRHAVDPFCARPVVPELPEDAAEKAAQHEIDQASAPAGAPVGPERFRAEPRVDWIEEKDEP